MFSQPQMTNLPAEKQAEKAIAHTLRNIAERPGVAWYLGHGTQTYALLTESLATLSGKGMDEIKSIYPPADQPDFADNHNTCPFCGSHALSGECDSDKEKHYMTCTDCGATGPTVIEWHHDSEKDAIDTAVRKWNERQMPR